MAHVDPQSFLTPLYNTNGRYSILGAKVIALFMFLCYSEFFLLPRRGRKKGLEACPNFFLI